MMRGEISNTLHPTLWIHSDVLVQYTGRKMLIGPKTYTLLNQSWLWAVSYFVKPVVVYLDQEPNPLLKDYDHLSFSSFNECRDALRRDQRAVEMVVVDPMLVCHEISLFSSSIKRYC